MLIGPLLFGLTLPESLLLWWSTEYVNLALVVPTVTMFALAGGAPLLVFSEDRQVGLQQAGALLFLFGCVVAATLLGGPGAMTLPLPALIWCAVQFRPRLSSLLAALTCSWFLVAVPYGWLPIGYDLADIANAASFRIGVAMILVAQFAVAGVNAAWRSAHASLAFSAHHDGLTGISNRAWFMRKTDEQLRQLKPGETACLLMIDIDKFKAINDDHGHPAGDAVIIAVAQALAAETRADDVVGRLGGEEFALLARNVAPMAARQTAERLCRAVEALDIALPHGPTIRVTVSIGARLCTHLDELDDALSEADAALYAAKRAGRNRVMCACEPEARAGSKLALADDVSYTPPIRSAGG
jgi:diguanylate cyclase (GGDEF)-like protein